jgi:hypothetical protein
MNQRKIETFGHKFGFHIFIYIYAPSVSLGGFHGDGMLL